MILLRLTRHDNTTLMIPFDRVLAVYQERGGVSKASVVTQAKTFNVLDTVDEIEQQILRLCSQATTGPATTFKCAGCGKIKPIGMLGLKCEG